MGTVIRIPPPNTAEWLTSMDPGGLFEQWHSACKETYTKHAPAAGRTQFARLGFEKMTFLDRGKAETLRQRIDKLAASPASLVKTGEYQDKVHELHDHYLFWVLEQVLNPEVEHRAYHYFKSEFCVHWYMYTRAYPYPKPDESFLWHRDGGPESFVNLMVYLNGTDEHGGGTQFIDKINTKKIAEAGYSYPAVANRLRDISEFAAKIDIDYKPVASSVEPGEGFMFQPTQVLHCGLLPTKGPRYVMFINLLPSSCPWREAFRRWTKRHMETVAGNWTPSHIALLAGTDGPTVIS